MSSKQVKQINVRAGGLVDYIEFVLSDGTTNAAGAHGGNQQEPFQLEDGDFVVEVMSRGGDSLDCVSFKTHKGKLSRAYGNVTGGERQSALVAPQGQQIVGVRRDPRMSFCPKLVGVILAPITTITTTTTPSANVNSVSVTPNDVKQINVRAGALIDQIEFELVSGAKNTAGGNGGTAQEPFTLERGDFIVEVISRAGNSLDAVGFKTHRGMKSKLYGNAQGGQPQRPFVAPIGKQIIGVERGGGGMCPVIDGILTAPAPSVVLSITANSAATAAAAGGGEGNITQNSQESNEKIARLEEENKKLKYQLAAVQEQLNLALMALKMELKLEMEEDAVSQQQK